MVSQEDTFPGQVRQHTQKRWVSLWAGGEHVQPPMGRQTWGHSSTRRRWRGAVTWAVKQAEWRQVEEDRDTRGWAVRQAGGVGGGVHWAPGRWRVLHGLGGCVSARACVAPVPATFLSCYRFSHYSLLKLKFRDLSLYELTVSFPGWAPFNIWKKLLKKNA